MYTVVTYLDGREKLRAHIVAVEDAHRAYEACCDLAMATGLYDRVELRAAADILCTFEVRR